VKKISQKLLHAVLNQRDKIAIATANLEAAEAKIFAALQKGSPVESGILLASIKRIERRSVSWRPCFEREISKLKGDGEGEKLAARILAATTPSVTESLNIALVKAA
jgi:hypothetical protein